MTKAALKRALADIHPDPEIAREFICEPTHHTDRAFRGRLGC